MAGRVPDLIKSNELKLETFKPELGHQDLGVRLKSSVIRMCAAVGLVDGKMELALQALAMVNGMPSFLG
jgi:hypothetical protein